MTGAKPHVVLIGAGLAGSILADALSSSFQLTIIELTGRTASMTSRVVDIGLPGRVEPFAASGLGGTTAFWHNGLIELEAADYDNWPIPQSELRPYLDAAYPVLSPATDQTIKDEIRRAHAIHVERAIPRQILGNCIYYPRYRRNLWRSLRPDRREPRIVIGEALRFEVSAAGNAEAVLVSTEEGEQHIKSDIFISCAGGLASPILLSETARHAGLRLPAAGRNLHDHPMAWVARAKLNTDLYDIWNRKLPGRLGVLRTPFVVWSGSNKFAFYFRPSGVNQRAQIVSHLTELRNHPLRIGNYLRVASNAEDIMEAIAFRFGVTIPTDNFAVLMVGEQSPVDELALQKLPDGKIGKRWMLAPDYIDNAGKAMRLLTSEMGDIIESWRVQPEWEKTIHTAAHFSGTCRMADTREKGVCDRDLKVFGTENLFVCDGSTLPTSGYANTGLTIAALALRLADHLKSGNF